MLPMTVNLAALTLTVPLIVFLEKTFGMKAGFMLQNE